ncbi:hypothetical protein VPH35_007904 [Triticum aestivum]
MLTTSAMNSLIPCLDSCDTLFTATSVRVPGSTPLYTLPNPPVPSSRLSLNPAVASNRSLNANRCGPNSTSQSSRSSAYLSRRRSNKRPTPTAARTAAVVTIGSAMASVFDWGLGPMRGSFGSLAWSSAGAAPSRLKLQPST